MKRIHYLMIVLFSFALVFAASAGDTKDKPIDPTKMTLEEIYQVKSFAGKPARMIKFSENDRYLSFLWNKYDCQGFDLYVYDLNNSKLTQITSIERMKQFDPPEDHDKFIKKEKQKEDEENRLQAMYYAQRDYLMGKDVDLGKFEKEDLEKLRKELKEKEEKKKKEEAEKKKKEEEEKKKNEKAKEEKKKDEEKELEEWELRDKLKEKEEKEKIKRDDLYPGVSDYEWSKTSTELIFVYRGDLYRYFPAENSIKRLTMTDEDEQLISYTPKGDGYYYQKASNVYMVKFNSSYILQLDHQLSDFDKDEKDQKFKVSRTSISPNGKWIFIVASKEKGQSSTRKVKIMDYKKRFAEPIEVPREVTDDKRNEPEYRFFLREIRETNYGKEPGCIFEAPGGDIWYEWSNISWTDDGSKYAFMTWEREKGDLKIWVGETAAGKKPEPFFEMKEKIGYKSFYYNNLKFTHDGKHLGAVLTNEDGFRQPVLFDLKTKKKREIIKGKFESHPIISFSKNDKYMYVESNKQDTAMESVYRVDLNTGEMVRIGKPDGMHRNSEISHNGKWLATMFGNWDKRPELHLFNTSSSTAKVLTQSHRTDWDQFNFIKPELFKYKNRHGQTLSGMIFKPEGWEPEDKRPGIVYMYGGPLGSRHTVETDTLSTLSYIFQMVMAAKHGYVTINIDPRGQSGYGQDFNEANFENPGESQVEDLEDLVKHIEKGFGVDVKRLGLHGWSFGGYQTLKTMFSSPGTFSCAIAAASVTEWENYNSWYTGSTIGKSVRGKPTMRKYSLLPLAKNLKSPLLLVHGMMDANVLYQDTLNVYKALLRAGKETLVDLFLDPEGEHGLGGIVKNKATFKKFESWFVQHLGK
jgi:dipeptidyl-peptidase-4